MNKKHYLGDGLYAQDDGFMFLLSAPREEGEHYVGLEPEVLDAFLRFIERSRGVYITVTPKQKGDQYMPEDEAENDYDQEHLS